MRRCPRWPGRVVCRRVTILEVRRRVVRRLVARLAIMVARRPAAGIPHPELGNHHPAAHRLEIPVGGATPHLGRSTGTVGIWPASAAAVAGAIPAAVCTSAVPVRLLGPNGATGLGSRIQPVGLLVLRNLDPAVTG
jgi:hypothetical protein